ncbi:MAG: Gfo/Idh/MocA family oxidoreductase [Archaeoglobaceae archaeon]
MLRTGVIGIGVMGKHHARVYSEHPDLELVGVSDVNRDEGKRVASNYGTTYFPDYMDLLEADLDLLSIAVPTSLHADIALNAADYGINMLIEKPISKSIEEAESIINAARENNVKVMVGHIERFNPAVVKLKEMVDKGEFGKIITISGRRIGPFNPRIRDVGIIIDLAVHEIDVFSYIFGKVAQEVYTVAGNNFHTMEDYASILLRFPDNASGNVDTNWLSPKKVRRMTVVGTECVAEVDFIQQELELWKNDKDIEKVKTDKEEPLKLEIQHFIDSINNNHEPEPNGEDGAYVLGVALSAIKSYRERKPISLDWFTSKKLI